MISRRTFLDGLAVTAASAAVSSTAKSYAQILGSNNRLNFAILGLNGRGYAHLDALQIQCEGCSHHPRLRRRLHHPRQIFSQGPDDARLRSCRRDRLPQGPRLQRCRRHHRRAARPLARAHGHLRSRSRKKCLRRKALQPQPPRGRTPRRSPEEVRQARPGRRPAALLRLHHQGHPADSRRPHRRTLLRQGLVREQAQVHGHRQTRPPSPPRSTGSSGRARLRGTTTSTTSTPTTGTGSPATAPAKPSTTAPTRSTSAVGLSASNTPPASPHPGAVTTSRTTGSSTTPSTPASNTAPTR